MDIPPATRPNLSGYIGDPMLLPWRWVATRLAGARNYWITTHSRDYPSSRPVWGVWDEPRILFSSGSQIVRNIARNPRIQLNLESGDELVLVEGNAHPLKEDDLELWLQKYNAKYCWDMPPTTNGVFALRPVRVLAWISDPSGLDRGAMYTNSATQWKFTEGT